MNLAESKENEPLDGSIPTVRHTVEGMILPANHVVMGCHSRSSDIQI